ncbi:hypothetical protein TRFO_23527 [Tritrichomonas foetus]|uniref:SSD domain-containing protein n=1 Tax=Tritrichomonas foetus TaxID=1144522 RepID=A0A1J4KA32_9EUKA|nr:hypothetical protein TRFO_23527 [Tritrichomonas foetus]|eukprot:OHT08083.1 hypothetical protein TRFO_23527 [Tritrichomonas foetus]
MTLNEQSSTTAQSPDISSSSSSESLSVSLPDINANDSRDNSQERSNSTNSNNSNNTTSTTEQLKQKGLKIDDHKNDFEEELWGWGQRYATFVYRHPYIPIIFTIVICACLYGWLFGVYGIQVSANTNYYRWSGDEISNRWDSYNGARDTTYASLLDYIGRKITMPRQSQMTQMGAIIYERKGQNILELEAIQEIWKTEDEMHATPGWSDHCFKVPFDLLPEELHPTLMKLVGDLFGDKLSSIEEDTFCVNFKSIITDIKTYMTSKLGIVDPKWSDLTTKILTDFLEQPDKADVIAGTYLGRDYDNTTHTTERLRSMFPFGLPILDYENKWDHYDDQNNILGKWQIEFMKPMKKMQREMPKGVSAFSGIPFALNYEISDFVLEQVWWLVGSFAFLFIFSIVVMRSFFLSILGCIGVFLPIPCAICLLQGIFTIHHIDVIDVIGLFLICGIGADCLFIVFEMFKQARTKYHNNNEKRLAFAIQHGIIALATSVTTAAVSFLALCTSGVRIMRFFGIFCFLMLLFTFIFTFTWYIGFLSIWARYFEGSFCGKRKNKDIKIELSDLGSEEVEDSYGLDIEEDANVVENAIMDYPDQGVFDFLKKKPTFNIQASGLKIAQYNPYEKFFHNYISSIVFHYRLPIVLVMFAFAVVFGYFCFQMPTKSELQFLSDDHPLQHALTLASNGFRSALNDFSFVYVWGLEEKPTVPIADTFTVTKYGYPSFKKIDFAKEENQRFLDKAWQIITNHSDLMDATMTEQFGASGMNEMKKLANLGGQLNPVLAILQNLLHQYTGINLDLTLPARFPMTKEEFQSLQFIWQLYLSLMGIDEPDSYVPGTLKVNTIGFSPRNYSLQFIGMKQNLKIPDDVSKENMRRLYNECNKIAEEIEDLARKEAPDMVGGYMTGVQWLTMVTEEKLPKQVILDVAYSFIFAFVVIFMSTFSITYSFFVIYSMVSVTFITMGILYFTNWKIGTNEAIMISIAAGFCADFIVQPMLAQAHDNTKRTRFGRLQSSLTMFCSPVTYACITTLVAACFLYPCEVLLFPPFATFLICSGLFGMVYGFIVLPALIALLGPKRGDSLLRLCGKKQAYEA